MRHDMLLAFDMRGHHYGFVFYPFPPFSVQMESILLFGPHFPVIQYIAYVRFPPLF